MGEKFAAGAVCFELSEGHHLYATIVSPQRSSLQPILKGWSTFDNDFEDFFCRLQMWCDIVEVFTRVIPVCESDLETNDNFGELDLCESFASSDQRSGEVGVSFTESLEQLDQALGFASQLPVVSGERNGPMFNKEGKEEVFDVMISPVKASQFWVSKLIGFMGSGPQTRFDSFVWKTAKLVATSH